MGNQSSVVATDVSAAASAAVAEAAAAARGAEREARSARRAATAASAEERARARADRAGRERALRDLPGFLRAIVHFRDLGLFETCFGATQECAEAYWEEIAEQLRARGYEVDLSFLEDRRAIEPDHWPLVHELPRSALELSSTAVLAAAPGCRAEHNNVFRHFAREPRDDRGACGACGEDEDGVGDGGEPVTVCRPLRALEPLWWLTLLGPACYASCGVFDCFACVCDRARWRATCRAPHRRRGCGLCCGCADFADRGAVWRVRVSWRRRRPAPAPAPAPAPGAALAGGAAPEAGVAGGAGGAGARGPPDVRVVVAE